MSESIAEMVIRLSSKTYLDRRIAGVWPDGNWKWQYRCNCGEWCWEDWCNCPKCGKNVQRKEGKFFKPNSLNR